MISSHRWKAVNRLRCRKCDMLYDGTVYQFGVSTGFSLVTPSTCVLAIFCHGWQQFAVETV